MENELYHHGILGQKWGVRRYQNKDGSLTMAGKKRALKMQNQYTKFSKNKKYRDKDGNLTYAGRKKDLKMKEEYSELTGGKRLRKFSSKSGTHSSDSGTESKTKSISEMSNKEIQDKIDRIRLENTLKSLTPKQTTAGERFANGLKDAAVSIAKDKGTKIAGDYIEKKLRDKLGLSKKETKTAAQLLQEEAQRYQARQTIDRGQQYFREGRYAESNESQTTSKNNRGSSERTETFTGTVEGEGTSRRNNTSSNNANNRRNDEPIDAEWRDVTNDDVSPGRDFVAGLLEDRRDDG